MRTPAIAALTMAAALVVTGCGRPADNPSAAPQ